MGLCPLFVFQGRVLRHELNSWTGVRAAAERVARSYGLEIFDVQLRRESIGTVLRVIIDRPDRGVPETFGGRGRDRRVPARQPGPERAARRRRGRARARRRSAQNYTLEVSSPGLDRPLRHEADYRRFTGRLAKVVTTEPVDGQSAFAGRHRRRRGRRRCCSRKGARRIGCRSRRSSAASWRWSFDRTMRVQRSAVATRGAGLSAERLNADS